MIATLSPLGREPYFSRDAIRTAAVLGGHPRRAVEAALNELASKPETDDLRALAAGRIVDRAGDDRPLVRVRGATT